MKKINDLTDIVNIETKDKLYSVIGFILSICSFMFMFRWFYDYFFVHTHYIRCKQLYKYLKSHIQYLKFIYYEDINYICWEDGDSNIVLWKDNTWHTWSVHHTNNGCKMTSQWFGTLLTNYPKKIKKILLKNYKDRTNKTYLCPLCKTVLINGPKHKYETLNEHVTCYNGPSEERDTLVCPNNECDFSKIGFWSFPPYLEFYVNYHTNTDNIISYNQYNIDIDNRKTFNRCGIHPINSWEWERDQDVIKRRNNFIWPIYHKIHQWYYWKICNKMAHWSIHLRNKHNPMYCLNRDKQSKLLFVLAQWLGTFNPFNFRFYKMIQNVIMFNKNFDVVIDNWAYHPYPWISIYVRYILKKNGIVYKWKDIIKTQTEKSKTRWA